MTDFIMFFAGVIFLILFSFLFFVFIVVFASIFKRKVSFENFTPPISILIPTYNEENNIQNCISSIFNQDYPRAKMELIVVDDGSQDKTIELAKSAGAKVFFQSHKGKSDALNLGISQAHNDFIVTIDADTVLEKNCLKKLLAPFVYDSVGATTANSKVKNSNTVLGVFQNIEYSYNNLIRASFSKLFRDGIWFFGALACYRKDVLKKAGYFKTSTLTEDMDLALDIAKIGYRTVNVQDATCYTITPSTIRKLYCQRERWWIGTLQALFKNRKLFSKNSTSLKFLFINQLWWSVYSFFSIPLILYQVNYWLPYNSHNIFDLSSYLIRWFSLAGPFYVLYKIPEWGVSFYNIFGVLSGIISLFMMVYALKMFKDRFSVSNVFGVMFYFPYTMFLNLFIILSLIKSPFLRRRFFIR